MKYRSLLFLIVLCAQTILLAQENWSKGDKYFFEYNYISAISEYNKENIKEPLSRQKRLNLATSYLHVEKYKSATDTYLALYKENDSISPFHFNNMLNAMSRTSGQDRVRAFLSTKSDVLSPELLENAEFNYELQSSASAGDLNYEIFNINSNGSSADFSPSFYKDDRLLFTSSRRIDPNKKRGKANEEYLNIFVSRIGSDYQILNPNPFTKIPSSEYHQATPYYSEQMNTVFFVTSNAEEGALAFDENGKNSLAIMKTASNGDSQFILRDLSTSFYYPHYDASNARLYFAANFPSGYGGTDLYYVNTNEGKIMSAPINLGPRINTPGNEVSPFVYENSFYFASDVFYGLGGMDIYKSEVQVDGSFSTPINLGKGLNSEKDDFGFIMKDNLTAGKGMVGYFSSDRIEGKGGDDIYGFLVDEKPGIKTLVVSGSITNTTSKAVIDKALVKLIDLNDEVLKEAYTKEDGTYRLEIPWRDSIYVEISKERYAPIKELYASGKAEGSAWNKGILLIDDLVEEREDQTVLKMEPFYFGKGKYQITPEIATELNKAINAITSFPDIQLRIESHTDSRGGGATNFRLSQRRAEAIRDYLLDHGVSSSNILYTVGYGEDKILNNCTNGVFCLEQFHNKNERQLLVVLNYELLF
ncbi:OmpA family protein [Eudoraea chungangensis]|uniref:OmpA family protein n=1 Tax=Eudoraea chungangensis TaxID=1481905 RepID=UPI0023ECC964|nr:OmpA family protein [Eudoraea chungangensis]